MKQNRILFKGTSQNCLNTIKMAYNDNLRMKVKGHSTHSAGLSLVRCIEVFCIYKVYKGNQKFVLYTVHEINNYMIEKRSHQPYVR